MKRFGLIGKNLSHSFSQNYFGHKFVELGLTDHVYDLIELDCIDQLMDWLIRHHDEAVGLNVTIPYKESVLPYLDYIDPIAKVVGAVNTIKLVGDNLHGYNTDVYGFKQSLLHMDRVSNIRSALILGTGGASKAVDYVLTELKISTQKVSRHPHSGQLAYDQLDAALLSQIDLVVNTTPIGTYPHIDQAPTIPYDALTSKHLLIDLIYNPSKTLFLERGMEQGCQIKNGLDMLYLQAEKAWEIWTSNETI